MEFQLKELDFRFADEEDSQDISILINHALTSETEGPESFRRVGSRITPEEVENDCNSSSTRWIVLETPRPEELLVAAGRIRMIRKESQARAIIDIFGTVDSESIRNILLHRLESICYSQAWYLVTFEIPSWSESIQNWLSSRGYEDLGGRTWPETQQDLLLKPTMILEFQKNLFAKKEETKQSTTPQTTQTATEAEGDDDGDDGIDGFDHFQIVSQSVEESGNDDPMKGLISNLFRALHAENEKEPIQPLEQNTEKKE